jgi:esterase/lipase superfamily enzyme
MFTKFETFLNESIDIKKITDSEEFKMWFSNSVMVNSDGTPMVFYHGTNNEFDEFDKEYIGKSTDAG